MSHLVVFGSLVAVGGGCQLRQLISRAAMTLDEVDNGDGENNTRYAAHQNEGQHHVATILLLHFHSHLQTQETRAVYIKLCV